MEDNLLPFYTWKPLSHDDSIRLLKLHPNPTKSSDIHITLTEALLSETLQYEALSYCWATEDGDDSKSQTIYCEGTRIHIIKNCEAALRRLRKGDEDRVLWIDAICINQSDDEERSSQVNMMAMIYKSAASVKIYLGEPSEDIDPKTKKGVSDTTVNFLAALPNEITVLA